MTRISNNDVVPVAYEKAFHAHFDDPTVRKNIAGLELSEKRIFNAEAPELHYRYVSSIYNSYIGYDETNDPFYFKWFNELYETHRGKIDKIRSEELAKTDDIANKRLSDAMNSRKSDPVQIPPREMKKKTPADIVFSLRNKIIRNKDNPNIAYTQVSNDLKDLDGKYINAQRPNMLRVATKFEQAFPNFQLGPKKDSIRTQIEKMFKDSEKSGGADSAWSWFWIAQGLTVVVVSAVVQSVS